MLQNTLLEFYERDLLKLKEELHAYAHEADIWKLVPGINNSAGTLALHIHGNLLHFVGATLAHTGYVRNREAEFSKRGVSRSELLAVTDETMRVVLHTISAMHPEDFEKEFPLEKQGKKVTTENMLIHLLAHLSYHLGQINYHRRLLTT